MKDKRSYRGKTLGEKMKKSKYKECPTMKEMAIHRLEVVRRMPDFVSKAEALRNDAKINAYIKYIESMNLEVLDLPDQFDSLIQGCIIVISESNECKAEHDCDKDRPIFRIDIDWDKLTEQLYTSLIINSPVNFGSLSFDDKVQILNEEKRKLVIGKKTTDESEIYGFMNKSSYIAFLITDLLRGIWPVIINNFPPKEFGFPTSFLISSVLSIILNKNFRIEERSVFLNRSHDIYGARLMYENNYLKRKLEQLGINIEAEEYEDGVLGEMTYLEEILLKTPYYQLVINPSVKGDHIRAKYTDIDVSINNIVKKYGRDIKEAKGSLDIINRDSQLFAEPYFVKGLIPTMIEKELQEFDYGSENSDIKDYLEEHKEVLNAREIYGNIKRLCENTGYEFSVNTKKAKEGKNP